MKIQLSAPLYIFLLIFLLYSFGFAANVTPPVLQIGLLVVPALALPEPFCGRGLAPPPLTADLFFCALVPLLWLDKKSVVTW